MTRFADSVAVVTGGASGMGLATARRWVADGGRVAIGDIDEPGLKSVGEELGDAVVTVRCDVTSEDDQQALVAAALSAFGRVDAAVACPAIGGLAAIVNMPLDEWRRVLDITLTGVMLTIKHTGRVMREGGAIVTIASVNATRPGPGFAAYNSAKAGVTMLTQIAAQELAPRGIRVNGVAPGLIRTPMAQPAIDDPAMIADWRDNTPLGRHGEPAEVAALICWLLSAEASYVTGDTIAVDGGTHTRRLPDMAQYVAFDVL
jgi:3-oxoacyl-[acyl-carrier protein] reductase